MGVRVINYIFKEIFDVVRIILSGQNILMVASVCGVGYTIYVTVRKSVLKKQKELIKKETKRIDDEQSEKIKVLSESQDAIMSKLGSIERNLLRTQLLMGVEQSLFSKSELLYFYDKYTDLGGNSFVSDKVKIYLERDDIK